MGKCKALVVLNLKALLHSVRFGGKNSKRKAASGVGAMVFIGVLALYLSGIYSFLFASQFAPLGMTHLVIMMMGVLAVIMGLLFTVFAAQGVIFGGRDNDLMLALPIPAFTLMLARTLALYVENLVLTVFVMLPAGAAYLFFGGTGGVGFLLTLVLASLFLALLPTALAVVVGYVLAWCAGKFARKALLSNLLYVGAFFLLMVFVFRLQLAIQTITLSSAMGIEAGFSGWGLPFLLLVEGTCRGRLSALLLFLLLCAVPFLLVVWFFAPRYKKIVTGLGAKSVRSDYKLGAVAARGIKRAILDKESRRFFNTPIYLFNAGMGLILLLLGGVASLFFESGIQDFLATMAAQGLKLPLLPVLCLSMAFLLSMTAITVSSISLEGKQIWILKEAPVRPKDIFRAKIDFQLLLSLPCVLVSALCLSVSFGLSLLDLAVLLLVGSALAAFCAPFGLYVNLCLPKLDGVNDALVVKNSGAALVGTLVPMLLCGALAALWLVLSGPLGDTVALLLCAAVPALGALGFWRALATRGVALWRGL